MPETTAFVNFGSVGLAAFCYNTGAYFAWLESLPKKSGRILGKESQPKGELSFPSLLY